MLKFDPRDPYPLVSSASLVSGVAHCYAEAQAHAAEVDRWLGLRTEAIEAGLTQTRGEAAGSQDQQLWVGLPVKAMLTPYTELRELLTRLSPPPGACIVDLGAGYGRMGFVIAAHWPEVGFVGYEYVQERVDEAMMALARAGAANGRIGMRQADLRAPEFRPIAADIYFLYDYGTRDAIEKTLQDLRAIAATRAITVVGRGRASRDAIERAHPWLSQVNPPEHSPHYSIYRA